MPDQADNLRQLSTSAPPFAAEAGSSLPLVLVTGSRTGVGTTTVVVNLAVALADLGSRVVMVDAAGGNSELARLAGLSSKQAASRETPAKWMQSGAPLEAGPAGTFVLAPRPDDESGAVPSRHAQRQLLADVQSLRSKTDFVIIDCGSHASGAARRFWRRAQLMLIVTTPDDAAIVDAYAAIKDVSADEPSIDARVVLNQCNSTARAGAAHRRLAKACEQFMGRQLTAVPSLPRHVARSLPRDETGDESPRVWDEPDSDFGHAVLWLGRAVHDAFTSHEQCTNALSATLSV